MVVSPCDCEAPWRTKSASAVLPVGELNPGESEAHSMSSKTNDCIVLQLAMASYRQEFLKVLEERGAPIKFLVGNQHFNPTVVTDVDSRLVHSTGTNWYFLGRRLAWQPHAVVDAVRAPRCVVELNPRNLTTWTIMLLRRLARKRTLAWGHAWPRRGRGARTDKLRGLMRSLADGLILYTYDDADLLRSMRPKSSVFVAPNSLYRAAEMQSGIGRSMDSLIWIGRFVPEKKPQLALSAFAAAAEEIAGLRLLMVGAGPELESCRALSQSLGISDLVEFPGWLTDKSALAGMFGRSLACIASGYVGLNVTQSLGYGCPVIYADNEPHAPEVVLLGEDNSLRFQAGSKDSLVAAIKSVWADPAQFPRDQISQNVRERYSVDRMADEFVRAVDSQ
jgi:glycosyltransferase involved in cell wall biosynthesis